MTGIGRRPQSFPQPPEPPQAPEPATPGIDSPSAPEGTKTAGEKLMAEFEAALAQAGREAGGILTWSEHERQRLAAAVELADRAERIGKMLAAEFESEQPRPSAVAKLSAEQRLLHRAVSDHLSHVKIGIGQAKSERHVRAANVRWSNG